MKKLLLIAPAVAILATVLVFALDFAGSDDGENLASGDRIAALDAGEKTERGARREAGEGLAAPTVAAAESDGSDDLERLLSSASTDLARILVVDAWDRPVQGAVVKLYRVRRDDRGFDPFGMGDDGSEAEQPLRTFNSDAEGTVYVPRTRRLRFRVEARKDELLGEWRPERDDGFDRGAAEPTDDDTLCTVVLRPLRRLEVQVVDPGGVPVPHILVTVAADAGRGPGGPGGPGGRGGRGGPGGGQMRRRSDPKTGSVKFEIGADSPLGDATAVNVRAQLAGLESPSQSVSLETEGTTRATLSIPPTVALDITVVEADQKPYDGDARVDWQVVPADSGGNDGNGDRGGRDMRRMFMNSPFGMVDVKGGHALIGGFAPGIELKMGVNADDRVAKSSELRLPPNPAIFPVTLALGVQQATLAMRLMEEDKTPAANESFQVELNLDGETDEPSADPMEMGRRMMRRMSTQRRRDTDRGGRIRMSIPPGTGGRVAIYPPDTNGGGFRMRFGGDPAAADDRRPLAVVTFPPQEPGATFSGGELILDRGPLLVAGVVVDAEKKPIPRARLVVSWRSEITNDDPRAAFGPGGQGPSTRRRVEAEENGTFSLRSDAPADAAFTVEVEDRRYVSETFSFLPGEKDVIVEALLPGGFEGKVRVADPSIKITPRLRVRQANATTADSSAGNGRGGRGGRGNRGPGNGNAGERNVRVEADGHFVVRGLRPGNYVLEASLDGTVTDTIEGIEVHSGQIDKPARLADLLIAQDWRLAVVTVIDPTGLPVGNARVSFVDLAAQETTNQGPNRGGRRGGFMDSLTTDSRGEVRRIVKSVSSYDLDVSHRDFAEKRVENPSFPATVHLDTGGVLVVNFAEALPAIEGIDGYRLVLSRTTDSPQQQIMNGFFGGNANRRTDLAGGDRSGRVEKVSGEYDVALQLRLPPPQPGSGRRGGADLRRFFTGNTSLPLGRVVVRDSGETSLAVTVDPAAVQKLVEERLNATSGDR